MSRVEPIEVNVRLLNFINKRIELTNFYAISAYTHSITLQGKFTPELVKELSKVGIEFHSEATNGYLCTRYKRIEITLT